MKSPLKKKSPGVPETTLAQLTTLGADLDKALNLEPSSVVSLEPYTLPQGRHQRLDAAGGINGNMKVLHCDGIPCSYNYKQIYSSIKNFGLVDRIRLKISKDETSFECYIVFSNACSAKAAFTAIKSKDVAELQGSVRLFDIRNFSDNAGDYVPIEKKVESYKNIVRSVQIPLWHVVTCKEGQTNLIKARDNLEDQVGEIGEKNLYHYGRNLLVKAEHDSQGKLLTTFSPEEDDIVSSVSPHKTFNTARGVVFCKDLDAYDETEILRRSSANVIAVKKLKGKNGAIQVTFHSSFLPPNVTIARIPLKVRKFRQKPMQCHKCFEFGHVIGYCPNNARCYMCSGIHDLVTPCTKDRFCFLCKGPHSPNWKECPRYKLEKEVLETAANEHISLGAARRRLKPWADPGRSFASIASVSTKAAPQALPVITISKGSKPISSPNSPEATDESGVGSFIKSSTEPPLNNSEMPAQVNIDSSSNSTERCLPASQLEIHEAPMTAAPPRPSTLS